MIPGRLPAGGTWIPLAGLVAVALFGPAGAEAQDLVERPPNLGSTSVPRAGVATFAFLHRFELVGEESEKLLNYPTLVLGIGLPRDYAIRTAYTSNSELGAGTANEWELALRKGVSPDGPFALAATAAWNSAAGSVDGEVVGRALWNRFSLHVAARGFSDAFGADEAAAALAGGAVVRLTPRLSIGADLARIVTTDTLPTAWSAGVQMAIPSTPHTLAFVVSNVGATTLQGASRGAEEADGSDRVRYGFAFTMPLGTLDQWARVFGEREEVEPTGEPAPADGAVPRAGVRTIEIRDFAFTPAEVTVPAGTTVHWVNEEEEVVHTVTADDGSFDSGSLQPGEGWSRRFDEPGRHPYHCTPHPFMKATVVVEPAGEEPGGS